MTEKEFWKSLDEAWEKNDHLKFRSLLNDYPQYIGKAKQDYERRLQEDTAFREQQDKKWEKMKARLAKDLGEDWVRENCC